MPSLINRNAQVRKTGYGFLLLLLGLLCIIVIPAHFDRTDHTFFQLTFILSTFLMASLCLVAYRRSEIIIGLVLAIPALLSSSWHGYLSYYQHVQLNNAAQITFLVYISAHVFRYLFETTRVSRNMIFAALCLYLLLGLIWTFIFLIIEMLQPGSLKLTVDLSETAAYSSPELVRDAFSDLLYYSFVTISTLGYGDITPVTRVARSWAMMEAITGQFFMAVVLARLVGLHIAEPAPNSASDSDSH